MENGHCTNDCNQLKRQLEAALEFEKLNHLIKDIRQRGSTKGRQPGNNNGKGKVINMCEGYLSKHYFDNLPPSVKARLAPTQTELVGFYGEQLIPMGKVELEVAFGSEVSYPKGNCYFGHPSNLSFRMPKEKKQAKQERNTEEVKPGRQGELAEEEILINPAFPEQKVTIGTQFSKECRFQLINLLKSNMDVFAWQPSDMTGFPKRIMKHTLNVNLSIPPVEKKRRVLGTEKSRAVDVSLCVDVASLVSRVSITKSESVNL
ncbi:hypothetical protein Tco_0730250 [Tanacetum coccineum]|uniref:Reverse transcriptase domain-containing protein n=1 Tax=Tanacetum coccineum TaxID=301880 RepID=A0ABQ4YR92_9ASTR